MGRVSAASSADFHAELARLRLSQSGLARLMREPGVPRSHSTVLRSVATWCRGVYAVPGEMWAVIRLLNERAAR